MKKIFEKIILAKENPLKIYYKVLRIFGVKIQSNFNITKLCRGDVIEVGALSLPAVFPFAKSIQYADVHNKEDAKLSLGKLGYFGYHKRKFVDVDVIFSPKDPPLSALIGDSKDCVFSSHSLEHSPNPVATLIDYLRVVKMGGIVYSIIPNKKFTYDNKRVSTSANKLIKRYNQDSWSYTIDEYRDVFINSDTHVVYDNSSEEDILKAYEENNGMHHIYVYDEENTLEIIKFVLTKISADLILFDSSNNFDIHFAIRKR